MSTNLGFRSDPAAGEGAITLGTTDVVEIDATGIRKGAGTRLAQTVEYKTGGVATGTTIIPNDDTIPQITEGTQFLAATITPQNALSRLEIEVITHACSTVSTNIIISALFRDAAVDALGSDTVMNINVGHTPKGIIGYSGVAGSTELTTFSVRVGGSLASTITLNGTASARKLGGVLVSSITIKEYLP